ncbi:MAG: hypothetical protein AAGA54_22405 [Myxococcota bacterium]
MLELLDAHPGNERFRNLLYADPGKIVTSFNGDDVVLFFEQSHGKDPLDNLESWYSQRKKEAAAAFAEVECADFNASLGKRIDAMNTVYSRRQAISRSLAPLMNRLQAGDQIIGIVEAFGKRPRNRPDRHPWKEHGSKRFVQPQPDKDYQDRLRNFRTVEWKTPISVCYDLINDPEINDELEAAAGKFIDELRNEGSAYLDYIHDYKKLHANSRAIVRHSMQRGFEIALLTEVGRDALVRGELNTLLRLIDATVPARNRQGSARVEAVENFKFDDWLGEPEPNPLGKAIAESWTGEISDSLDGGTFILGLLSQGLVAVVQEGRRMGVVEEPLYAMLFRQVVAVTKMTPDQEAAFEAALTEFSKGGKFSVVKGVFFDEGTGGLSVCREGLINRAKVRHDDRQADSALPQHRGSAESDGVGRPAGCPARLAQGCRVRCRGRRAWRRSHRNLLRHDTGQGNRKTAVSQHQVTRNSHEVSWSS